MVKGKIGFLFVLVLVMAFNRLSLGAFFDDKVVDKKAVSDSFDALRLENWRIPPKTAEFRIVKLAPTVGVPENHSLKISWSLSSGVSSLQVPPKSTTRYTLKVHLDSDSFKKKTFKLASGTTETFELSNAPVRDGNGLIFSGKVTTEQTDKLIVVVQEKIEELDEKGRVVNTWFTKHVRREILDKEK